MFRGTSLPRHLRSGAESSGSVQNPLLRGRSSNHSEPSVDTSSTNPSHHDQLPPAALSVTTATPSVVHASSQSVDLSVVMRELSAMRKEMKQAIAHLQAEQAKIGPAIAYLTELLLTIEKSPFKEPLNKGIATLYCKSLTRQPSNKDILEMIGTDHTISTSLKERARQFCKKRLTDIWSEERRQLFGKQLCDGYVKLSTNDFAEKFLTSQKVDMSVLPQYTTNLAVLRTFVRTVPHSTKNTFSEFRNWLKGITVMLFHHLKT
ncbi:hypothetical protein EMCRGX_G021520 [Ephydatia muelleri]